MWRFNSSSSIKSIMLLLTVFIMMANCEQSEEVLTRSKRSYYGGYDMYGLVSSPIIAQSAPVPIPVNYDNIPGNANYIQHTRQAPRQIHVDSSPRDSEISRVMVPGDQVMFSAEDRYYTSSTAPATAHRPDAYNVSRY
ncbi:uncharacterized protein CELE_F52A8.3 [Caenorhabditis elegans]|uniref:Secreted protein n=1 Tax=Caenorhabditis elegans TaxID=6239 RepID=Q20635_CAEEL|nr:Secreted protein [Caenorhabditis elegans]CAA95821.1 Secreted protein [Caenorhabditis elegans]|eukprot:NP_001021475.1 Uncharacterized protein CELE_F52A8.3 [Caenorhabditis elegans]